MPMRQRPKSRHGEERYACHFFHVRLIVIVHRQSLSCTLHTHFDTRAKRVNNVRWKNWALLRTIISYGHKKVSFVVLSGGAQSRVCGKLGTVPYLSHPSYFQPREQKVLLMACIIIEFSSSKDWTSNNTTSGSAVQSPAAVPR